MSDNGFSWDEWNRTKATRYPQNHVVQYCLRQFPSNRQENRALDLGCGSGAHTIFLAAEGFEVSATDMSPVGIANAAERLRERGLRAELRVESAEIISFPENFFDLVVCIGIFDTVGPEIATTAVERLIQVMKFGASGIFLFCSDLDDAVRGENSSGLYGYTREEVSKLFCGGFDEIFIDNYNLTYLGGAVVQNEWVVTVRR